MRHTKLITAGILILTFFFVNELQQTLSKKIKIAGSQIIQAELTAFLWKDMEEDEIEEDSRGLIDPYPQASVLIIMEKLAYKLISLTEQSIANSSSK